MDDFYIKWAAHVLSDAGYQIHASIPDTIQDNPWAVVYRFKTNQGFVFLKRVPRALAIESKVINILFSQFQANAPLIIAENQEQHCFLMKDAGIPLHEYFKQNFQSDILIEALQNYAMLQIMTTKRIKLFLDIGVPDWRLEKLPVLYQDLLTHEKLLLDDGLSKDDLFKLNKLVPKLSSLCEKLSSYRIKETFCHADFHDKNILIDINTLKTTIIDLGEVVVTHPFFSLLNCIHRAKENFSLTEAQYQQLKLACLKPWVALDTQEHLLEILAIIQQCWPIHGVLGEFRLLTSINQLAFQELRRQGRLANTLRYWIDQ